MKNCLVSIITISRNHCSSLQKTLDSVRSQCYQHIEHIVVDGDSTDGSRELLNSYSHSKVYKFLSEPDTGISNAFNKGLDKSTGDLIFFLNSGDVLYSGTVISEVVDSYMTNKWKFAVGTTVTTTLTGEPIFYQPPQLSSRYLRYFMFLPHQGVFCETALHKSYHYDECVKISMDYDLFLRMLKNTPIFYLSIIISDREPGGISSQTSKRIAEQSQIRVRYARGLIEKFMVRIINTLILIKSCLKIESPFAAKIRDD
jgi:putative colanic acid biosynthesis glycosyltransferase